MNDFIVLLIIGSSWCWGVFTLFHEGYLLERAGNTLRRELGSWFSKPLFDCPPCQASIHGFAIGFIHYGLSWQIPIFMICLCGLNFIIKSIIFPEYE